MTEQEQPQPVAAESADNNVQLIDRHQVMEASPKLRNLIVELLRSGSVLYDLDSEQYKLLRSGENLVFIRSLLRNLNLDLVVNPEVGLAFIRNLQRIEEIADDEEEDPDDKAVRDRFLISRTVLTPFKAVLILVLRKYYQERYANGETEIVTDIDYIRNALMPYLKTTVSESKDNRKLNGALKDLAEYHLIKRLSSEDDDRFQILPLIRYVIDVNKLEDMLEKFRELNGTDVAVVTENQSGENS